jgi:hypothetical protein
MILAFRSNATQRDRFAVPCPQIDPELRRDTKRARDAERGLIDSAIRVDIGEDKGNDRGGAHVARMIQRCVIAPSCAIVGG